MQTVHAQTLEPILFSSKQDLTVTEQISPHTIISSEELENDSSVVDSLKNIPGVEVSKTGIGLTQASLSIRGSEGRHVLILIDGVKVFDPTDVGGTLNLGFLNTLDIEKIEVLQGSQSLLHGSSAIGGVVNIITKKVSDKNSLSISKGVFSQVSTENTIELGSGLLYLNAFYKESSEFNVAREGSENDLSLSRGINMNHSIEFGKAELESTIKINDSFSEVDGFDSTSLVVDDESAYIKSKHYFLNEKLTYKNSSNKKNIFNLSYNKFDRTNKYTDYLSNLITDKFSGSSVETEWRSNTKINKSNILYGINTNHETFLSSDTPEQTMSIFDTFFNYGVGFDEQYLDAGLRLTTNADFGSYLVYNLGWEKKMSQFQTLSLLSKTGYKAPSIYQQKAPANSWGPVGNIDLAPEKSQGFELVYQLLVGSASTSQLALFYNEVSDFIGWETGTGYANISKHITTGVELGTDYTTSTYSLGANFTGTHHELSTGKDAQRKPDKVVNLNLTKFMGDQHHFSINWNWKGRRFEYSGTTRYELKAYDTFDFDYVYKKSAYKILFGLENIFNRDYQVARGYAITGQVIKTSLVYQY
jgi:vitamin B12 transporter